MKGIMISERGSRKNNVRSPLDHQPDLIIRSGCERQQRRRTQPVEINVAVDVRKKIHRYVASDTFFIAEEETILQFSETRGYRRRR